MLLWISVLLISITNGLRSDEDVRCVVCQRSIVHLWMTSKEEWLKCHKAYREAIDKDSFLEINGDNCTAEGHVSKHVLVGVAHQLCDTIPRMYKGINLHDEQSKFELHPHHHADPLHTEEEQRALQTSCAKWLHEFHGGAEQLADEIFQALEAQGEQAFFHTDGGLSPHNRNMDSKKYNKHLDDENHPVGKSRQGHPDPLTPHEAQLVHGLQMAYCGGGACAQEQNVIYRSARQKEEEERVAAREAASGMPDEL